MLTFFCATQEDADTTKPVADVALSRGHFVRYTKRLNELAGIGIYCQHNANPKNSKFSMVMLHDLGQEYWPETMTPEENFWNVSPWNDFDIAILPGRRWSECWTKFKLNAQAQPKFGVFEAGYPKSDCIFQKRSNLINRVTVFKKILSLKSKNSILFAPSWETNSFRNLDTMIKQFAGEDVNVLVKYAPNYVKIPAASYPENFYFLNAGTSIMDCLAISNLVISDESNCMAEALLFDLPSIAVKDWDVPEIPSMGLSERQCQPPQWSILSSSEGLRQCTYNVFNDYENYRQVFAKEKNYQFSNLGKSAITIVNILEKAVQTGQFYVNPL